MENQMNIDIAELPKDIEDDIREWCKLNYENGLIENNCMELSDAVNCYLKWNGVIGYTSQIMAMFSLAKSSK